MKLVLAGDYGTRNLGDQGMLAVLRERLVERGEADISVLSRHPSPEYERMYRVRTLRDFRNTDASNRGRWFDGLNPGDSRTHLREIASAIEAADMLVLGGGRMFFDHHSSFLRGDLAAYAQLVTLAHFYDTPVMLFAMSVVPETSDAAREYVRYIAEGAGIITVREISSRENLVELGVAKERVHVLPDPTLGLPYLEPEGSYGLRSGAEWLADADERLGQLEVDPDRKHVAVNVRSFEWRDGAAGQERTEEQLAALLDRVVEKTEAQLIFVPQRTYDNASREELDDRWMTRRVIERMERGSDCRAMQDELSIWQALAIYRRMSALISMRRHGLTFALTQRVPVVAISLDENTDVLMSTLGNSRNSVRLSPQRSDRSVEVIRDVLDSGPDEYASLFAHVEECAAQTRAYADLILERLSA